MHQTQRYTPSLEEVRALARPGMLVPVYRAITADLETPVSAYLKLRQSVSSARWSPSFLLESVEGGEQIGRYSFLGIGPQRGIEVPPEGGWIERGPDGWRVHGAGEGARDPRQTDPLELVAPYLGRPVAPVRGLPRFHGGFVGYLGYECAGRFERLPTPHPDSLGVPDAVLLQFDDVVVFDHVLHEMKVVSHVLVEDMARLAEEYAAATERIEATIERLRQPLDMGRIEAQHAARVSSERPLKEPWSNIARSEYEALVEVARRAIEEGEVIQVVPSRRIARPTYAHPFALYRALRRVNPSPFMFYLDFHEFQLIGSSPELLVQVDDGMVRTWPIAGTRRRGATPEEDEALERELLSDEKERAEHVMLVDLGRNDIGRVSVPGTVRVSEFMAVERYSHVMHIVSKVEGRLRPELTPLDALRACFPAGTVTGAPKIRAMELIHELEPDRRGPYAGAVGFLAYAGTMEMAITIRTMLLKGGIAYVQAGGGIVYDSVPALEFEETENKARALLRAIETAEQDMS